VSQNIWAGGRLLPLLFFFDRRPAPSPDAMNGNQAALVQADFDLFGSEYRRGGQRTTIGGRAAFRASPCSSANTTSSTTGHLRCVKRGWSDYIRTLPDRCNTNRLQSNLTGVARGKRTTSETFDCTKNGRHDRRIHQNPSARIGKVPARWRRPNADKEKKSNVRAD